MKKVAMLSIVSLILSMSMLPLTINAPVTYINWPKFHHDLALSGYSTSPAPNTNDTLWIYNTGSDVRSSPAIVDRILYIGAMNGKLYALDAETGSLLWTYQTGGAIRSSPAVASGKVYFGSGDGKVYALGGGVGGGSLIWSVHIGGNGWSSPAVHGGNVFIASENGTIFSLDAGTGAKVWSKVIGGFPNGPITVVNGKVYSGTHSGNPTLIALNEADGSVVWQYLHPTGGFVNSNGATVVDGDGDGNLDVYFGIVDFEGVGQAIALNEADGSVKWTYTFQAITGAGPGPKGPGWSTSTPAVHSGMVFIGSDDQNVYALDAGTGGKIWNYTTKACVWTAPAVADGKVFVASNDHTLYALDELAGGLIWSYNTSASRISGSPAVACGKVFLGNENGKVYAFGPRTLKKKVYVELLRNGDFSNGLKHWKVRVENLHAVNTYDGPTWLSIRPLGPGWTDIKLVNEPSRTNVLDIIQTVSDGDGDWTGVYQTVNRDVSGFSELYFEADGKAMFQSLAGDGWVGGEYPVHFIITYKDANGVDHNAFLGWPPNPAWQQGFYYTSAGDPDGLNPYSNKVTQDMWFHYKSPNLMNLSPAPKIIKTVRLYSSGWAYHGRIDNAQLYGTPPSAELGDVIHVKLEVTVPCGETVTIVDTLPPELTYIGETFMVNGAPAVPAVKKTPPPPPRSQVISYTITTLGTYVIEFDVKVTEAYWEERELCNVVTATWYNEADEIIDEREAVACFIIHAFEELKKGVAHIDWPMFHHDLALTGYSTSTAPDTNATLWIYDTKSSVRSSPAIVDGRLYIGVLNGSLIALDADTGAPLWNYPTGGAIYSSPAVAYGKVYILSTDGNMYALDAGTGALVWSLFIDSGPWPWSSPAVHDGKVFIAASNGTIFSLDAETGAVAWSTAIGGQPDSPIAVVNGKVYSGTHNFNPTNPTLVALDELTGAIIWTYNYTATHSGLTGMINSNGVAVADGDGDGDLEVYFGLYVWGVGGIGEAVALDEATGTEVWTYTFRAITAPSGFGPGQSTSTPAVHDGKIYIGSDDGYAYALDGGTGAKVWDFQTQAAVWSAPAVADGKVFVASLDHIFYALDETTGSLVWSYNTSLSRMEGSPAVACGKVFVGNENGKIYAFGPLSSEAYLTIKEKTDVQWTIEIEVTNPFPYTMTNVVIKDRFGAEIEIDEPFPYSITHGTVLYTTKGKSQKIFLTWEIGDLLPGETARLILLVSTDLNPKGHQEYTEPGIYELNSGATLKFIDPEQDIKLSAVTDSIYVTVLPIEDC